MYLSHMVMPTAMRIVSGLDKHIYHWNADTTPAMAGSAVAARDAQVLGVDTPGRQERASTFSRGTAERPRSEEEQEDQGVKRSSATYLHCTLVQCMHVLSICTL